MSLYENFESLRRSGKPNHFLVAPEGLCRKTEPDMASPLIRKSPEALFKRLVAFLERSSGWKEVDSDPEGLRISAVAVTGFLRFKDDVDVQVFAEPGLPEGQIGSRLAIYSRSRIGHSDFGTNEKRVRKLLDMFPKA